MFHLFFEMVQPCNEFTEYIEFQIDFSPCLYGVEIGMLVGKGDNVYLERVVRGITYCKADTVYGNGAFVYAKIAFTGHFAVEGIAEGVDVTALGVFNVCAYGCLVDVSLDDVPVEACIYSQGTFQIHFVAYTKVSEVCFLQGFAHGSGGVGVAVNGNDGKTHAVVCQTLCRFQLWGYGATEGEVDVFLVFFDGYDGSHSFDDS